MRKEETELPDMRENSKNMNLTLISEDEEIKAARRENIRKTVKVSSVNNSHVPGLRGSVTPGPNCSKLVFCFFCFCFLLSNQIIVEQIISWTNFYNKTEDSVSEDDVNEKVKDTNVKKIRSENESQTNLHTCRSSSCTNSSWKQSYSRVVVNPLKFIRVNIHTQMLLWSKNTRNYLFSKYLMQAGFISGLTFAGWYTWKISSS